MKIDLPYMKCLVDFWEERLIGLTIFKSKGKVKVTDKLQKKLDWNWRGVERERK